MIKIKILNPFKGRNEPSFRPLFFVKDMLREYSIDITDSDDYDYLFIGMSDFINKKVSLESSIDSGLEFLSKIDGDYFLFDGSDSHSLMGSYEVFNQSNAIAYSEGFVSNTSDYNFQLLDNAYRNVGKAYAKLKITVESNKCVSENCSLELPGIKMLEESPQASLDFLSSLISEFSVTEESNFDPNNNYRYTAASSLMSGKPRFSKTDGYNAYLDLLPDGSQQISFVGPAFNIPLVINSASL